MESHCSSRASGNNEITYETPNAAHTSNFPLPSRTNLVLIFKARRVVIIAKCLYRGKQVADVAVESSNPKGAKINFFSQCKEYIAGAVKCETDEDGEPRMTVLEEDKTF